MATKKDVRKELVNTVIESMKGRDSTWQKTWANMSETPYNPITGNKYSGVNLLALSLKQTELNTSDPRWCTFKQAVAAGYKINKDSKAAHANFYDLDVSLSNNDKEDFIKAKSTREYISKIIGHYKALYPDKVGAIELSATKTKSEISKDMSDKTQFALFVKELNKTTGAEIKLSAPMVMKSFPIFNYSQLQNVPELEIKPINKEEAIKRVDDLLLASGAKIRHDRSDDNFYSTNKHEIHLTTKESFKNPDAYYSTVLHEVAHWTKGDGVPLSNLVVDGEDVNSHAVYTRKELRTELANIFMSSELGVKLDVQNRPSHAGSYIELLNNDYTELFTAVTDAHKIATHVLGFEKRLDLESAEAKELQTKNPELYQKIAEYTSQESIIDQAKITPSNLDKPAHESDLPWRETPTAKESPQMANANKVYLEAFFEKKDLPPKEFTITHNGTKSSISNKAVIDYITNSIDPASQVKIKDTLIYLDSIKGDVNKYLEFCAKGMVLQKTADLAKSAEPTPEVTKPAPTKVQDTVIDNDNDFSI